jgi:hypothetical protein
VVTQAFLIACRLGQRGIATLLLSRCIALDATLGVHLDGRLGQGGFVAYLIEHFDKFGGVWHPAAGPWETYVGIELRTAIEAGNLPACGRWPQREPGLLGEAHCALQVHLLEQAVLQDRGPFLAGLLAMEYGKAHLIPLLTPIWPLPDDLCHAAGVGDFSRVRGWFDKGGIREELRRHYSTNDPSVLRQRRWTPARPQQILDH